MVISDYLVTMSRNSVRIAQLKARLSEYLRAVRQGRELTVFDRDQPIARLVPYSAATSGLVVREPVHAYPTLGKIPMPRGAGLAGDVVDVLLEDRRRER
jgi:prevent-host-death family protein